MALGPKVAANILRPDKLTDCVSISSQIVYSKNESCFYEGLFCNL